ncbi:MAG: alpha/beta hydrolase [Desulfobacula sp.]|nr:alpha/beta hydrolase [Desulfobacula sp.]
MTTTRSHILCAIFRQLKSRPGFDSIGIENYRKLLEKSALAFRPDNSIKTKSFYINTIQAQWLQPEVYNKKYIIMYIHGGGYVAGSIKSHKDLASRIALACEAKTMIFNYRLAPEHPFPAGLEDVKTTYQWLLNSYTSEYKISIVADSAGAGLALGLLSLLLKESKPLPVCAVLLSPWVDLECKNKSLVEKTEKDPLLNLRALKSTARLYTDHDDLSNPLISPINNDFTGICPILIQTGENEVLIDDSKNLAKKLENAGAIVKLDIWKGMFHVWHYFARYLPEGKHAIKKIGDFVNKYSQ